MRDIKSLQAKGLTVYATAAKTERAALERIIHGMREMGWEPTAFHDGEERTKLATVPTASQLTSSLMATDEASLMWSKVIDGQPVNGTMFFVFGNSPHEVMADSSYFPAWNEDLALVEQAINLEGEL